MTKTSKIWCGIIIGLAVILTAAVIRLAMINATISEQNAVMSEYGVRLENMYDKAYFELTDSMRNMQNNLSKLTVSTSKTLQQTLLSDIIGQANTAQSDLGALPLQASCLEKSATFVNKTADYCAYLQRKLAEGGEITEAERQNLKGLAKSSKTLGGKLCDMADGIGCQTNLRESGYDSSDDISVGFDEINDTAFDYPQLIYDGPFSDAKKQNITVNLPAMTSDEVRQKIIKELSSLGVNSLEFEGRLTNKADVYNYRATLDNGKTLYVQATVNGGMIALISSNGGADGVKADEAMKTAKDFAVALGYDVEPVWVSKEGSGSTYVNLAPVVNGVIIYPDLVKVAVSSDGVCGFESFNYLANHKARQFDKKYRDSGEAAAVLSPYLTVKNVNMALVPKNDKEILCFEFECEADGDQYFVFVDADTNTEVDIFKVIKGTEGYTVM